jgi:hypothetical protein
VRDQIKGNKASHSTHIENCNYSRRRYGNVVVPKVALLSFRICYVQDVVEPRLSHRPKEQGMISYVLCVALFLSQVCYVLDSDVGGAGLDTLLLDTILSQADLQMLYVIV